ncbi:MAG: alkaline phosphatase [bacterium]
MRFIAGILALTLLPACSQATNSSNNTDNTDKPVSQEEMPSIPAAQSPLAENEWYELGQATLAANLAKKPINHQAKNVILFIADGMDPTTVTAARIYDGQQKGMPGESNVLNFETLPHLAMSKTYNTNMQVPDSAGTASAMMTGIKTKAGVISITDEAMRNDCQGALAHPAITVAELAEQAGMAVGVVSTARLTHATPATTYAHSANRNWESDADMPQHAEGCKDIAAQLIDWPFGDGVDVALGGGRRGFMPKDQSDPEIGFQKGKRKDGRDLIAEWQAKSDHHKYVWNSETFNAVTIDKDLKLLGLFNSSHMQYEADRANDQGGEPSIAEMTEKAIDRLSLNDNGYFLMVEGGRVDHAHHAGNAARALADVRAFDAAVKVALEKTDPQDTLIIVTADHGHTLALQGYPKRGNPILGLVYSLDRKTGLPENTPLAAADGKPYTTLSYGNGPGGVFHTKKDERDLPITRPVLTDEDVADLNFKQQSLVPMGSETHGGQDVTIYARGPRAWLFDGPVEQNYIFHVMEYALNLNARAQSAEAETQ